RLRTLPTNLYRDVRYRLIEVRAVPLGGKSLCYVLSVVAAACGQRSNPIEKHDRFNERVVRREEQSAEHEAARKDQSANRGKVREHDRFAERAEIAAAANDRSRREGGKGDRQ